MKKVGIIVLLFSMFLLTACKTFEETLPTSYGDWENNYIYKANYKMKTDGTDVKPIIEHIEIEDKTYYYALKIENDNQFIVIYTYYKHDYIYFMIQYENQQTAILSYAFDSEKTAVVYHSQRQFEIFQVFNLSVIIQTNSEWLEISHSGDILIQDAHYYRDYIYVESYIFSKVGNSILYRHQDSLNMKTLFIKEADDQILNKIEVKNGFIYIHLKYKRLGNDDIKFGDVYAYDLSTQTLTLVSAANQKVGVDIIDNNYFMTFEVTTIKNDQGQDKLAKFKNILYRYQSNGIHQEMYAFDEKMQITYHNHNDRFMNFTALYYSKQNWFSDKTKQNIKSYHLNLDSQRLKKDHKSLEMEPQGFSIDTYIYYTDSMTYGGFMGSRKTYYLKRYDTQTKTSETMLYLAAGQTEGTNIELPEVFMIFERDFYDTIRNK